MRSRGFAFLAVLAIVAGACSSTPAATTAPTAAPATAAPATAAPATAAPATAAPATAAASGGTSVRDTLQAHWLGDCTCIWHPVDYETFSQAINFEMMFSTLVDRQWHEDGTFGYQGDLAASWSTSDAKTYEFKMNPNIKWHDGTPFTTADIAWTINESQKWSPGKFKNDAWDAVVGGKEARDAFKASGAEPNLSGIKVVDDSTIDITIENPNANWLFDVAEPDAVILPQHILKDLLKGVSQDKVRSTIETSPFATTSPIGTGPYKFIKYETDQYSQFEAFPDYFKGPAKIKNVFIKRMKGDAAVAAGEAGELDSGIL